MTTLWAAATFFVLAVAVDAAAVMKCQDDACTVGCELRTFALDTCLAPSKDRPAETVKCAPSRKYWLSIVQFNGSTCGASPAQVNPSMCDTVSPEDGQATFGYFTGCAAFSTTSPAVYRGGCDSAGKGCTFTKTLLQFGCVTAPRTGVAYQAVAAHPVGTGMTFDFFAAAGCGGAPTKTSELSAGPCYPYPLSTGGSFAFVC
jgi:hypothetical protein